MKPQPKPVASLTVHDVSGRPLKARKRIANWLHNLAAQIENEGEKYTDGRFCARLRFAGSVKLKVEE